MGAFSLLVLENTHFSTPKHDDEEIVCSIFVDVHMFDYDTILQH